MSYNNNNSYQAQGNPYQQQNPYQSQQAANPYQEYQGNPYEQQQSTGYGNGYGAQEQHEMQPYGQSGAAAAATGGAATGPVMSQQQFLAQVSSVRGEIRSLTTSVQAIESLHQRALTGNDPSASGQLEQHIAQTQVKNTQIRNQLRLLQRDAERTSDSTFSLKKRQFETLNNEFKKELQGYLSEEQKYRERYRDQIARQYRIVNPDASESEVREAADQDWGSEGIFQTALRTNRSGQASAVLGAVRARHNELQKIEQSITELSGMFNDLDTLVVQQDPIVEGVEQQTGTVVTDLEGANKQVAKATDHAKRRRRLKWWCALVVFLIILAIALGVGLGVALTRNSTKSS